MRELSGAGERKLDGNALPEKVDMLLKLGGERRSRFAVDAEQGHLQPQVEEGGEKLLRHQHRIGRSYKSLLHHDEKSFGEHLHVFIVVLGDKILSQLLVLKQLDHQNAEETLLVFVECHQLVLDDKGR